MGAWGVTMRESDYGLDLLELIRDSMLVGIDYKYLNVSEAIELLRKHILDEIKKANRGCTPEELDFYIKENFQRDFEEAALLIAECLADYYEHGELVIYDFSSGNTGRPERYIRDVIVTDEDLKLLLTEMRKALPPESELYNSWEESEHLDEWHAYVKALCQTLERQSGS